jgi:phosphoribosyl-ATP pyrophosphohydrolase
MSLLQEYRQIKQKIGEEKFEHIEAFLNKHPQYLLSDVYYKENVWQEFERWEGENYDS